MSLPLLVVCVLSATLLAYALGLRRALSLARNNGPRSMHSLPEHHGMMLAVWCGAPALLMLGAWALLESSVVEALVRSTLPEGLRALPPDRLGLVMNEVGNAARGQGSGATSPAILQA